MASQGPLFPTVGANVPNAAGTDWVNPGNILADDNVNSTITVAASGYSDYLTGSSYGFTIPSGATIDGIVVEVNDLVQTSGVGTPAGTVYVTKDTGATYESYKNATFPVGWYTYGGSTDLWGSAWTATEINATGFGSIVAVSEIDATGFINVKCDAMRITVYYTEVAGQTAYPDADIDAASWTTAPLFSKLNEIGTPNDTTFITTVAT